MQHLRILRQQSCPGCGRTCPKWNRRGHLHAVRLRFGNCGFRNSVCDNNVAPPKPYISLAGYNLGSGEIGPENQTNLAVANPHRKSFGRYDCDMMVLIAVQAVLLSEVLTLTI